MEKKLSPQQQAAQEAFERVNKFIASKPVTRGKMPFKLFNIEKDANGNPVSIEGEVTFPAVAATETAKAVPSKTVTVFWNITGRAINVQDIRADLVIKQKI